MAQERDKCPGRVPMGLRKLQNFGVSFSFAFPAKFQVSDEYLWSASFQLPELLRCCWLFKFFHFHWSSSAFKTWSNTRTDCEGNCWFVLGGSICLHEADWHVIMCTGRCDRREQSLENEASLFPWEVCPVTLSGPFYWARVTAEFCSHRVSVHLFPTWG